MSFTKVNINEASPEDIRAYATAFLGIQTEGESDAKVLAKVRAANDGDMIYVSDAPEVVAAPVGSPPPKVEEDRGALEGGLGRNDPKVRITVHADEKDGVVNSLPLEVGVNGVVWLIKRGESVEVPYRIYENLKNAVRTTMRHDREGNDIIRNVQTVAFNVESMPPQAEIDAWHERTKNQFVPS